MVASACPQYTLLIRRRYKQYVIAHDSPTIAVHGMLGAMRATDQTNVEAYVSYELQLLTLIASAFVVLATLFLAFVYPTRAPAEAQQSHAMVPCERITIPRVPDGYAPPVDIFSRAPQVILSATCGNNIAGISAGGSIFPQFIYRYGYTWRNGAWERFSFTGSLVGDAWVQNRGYATLPRTNAELQKENHVIAYICTHHEGRWKCGCPTTACESARWTLQTFSRAGAVPQAGPRYLDPNDFGGGEFPHPIPIPEIAVFYPSTYVGGHGTRLTLSGYGFAPQNNTVIFRTLEGQDFEVPNIPSPSTRSLSVTVPDGIPYGVYSVIVRHTGGRSFNSAMFTVRRPGAQAPVITRISPAEGAMGTRITLHGENFAPQGNIVYTTYGMIPNVSSLDGRTLTFVFDPFPTTPELAVAGGSTQRAEIKIQVANENGMTRQPALFNVLY